MIQRVARAVPIKITAEGKFGNVKQPEKHKQYKWHYYGFIKSAK
jgi:hypothetical protein